MGAVIKVHVFYDRPFWRDDGLSGHVTSDPGLLRLTFDQTPPGRHRGRPGRLHRLAPGVRGRADDGGRPAGRRHRRPRPPLRRAGRATRSAYYERSWLEEEWSRGCYTGMMTPGTWSTLGPGAARARRADPLGRDRDRGDLERLHGRRDPLRRGRGRRGARRGLAGRRVGRGEPTSGRASAPTSSSRRSGSTSSGPTPARGPARPSRAGPAGSTWPPPTCPRRRFTS